MSDLIVPTLAAPLDETNAEASQNRLGFSVPRLLTRLYSLVGNGGFGPGYGLLGLLGGVADEQGYNAIELYELNSLGDPGDPDFSWPDKLLPICHWGCAIYSCIDCESETGAVITFDPNLHDKSWSQCFVPTRHTFETWLDRWAAGASLWDEMYPQGQET